MKVKYKSLIILLIIILPLLIILNVSPINSKNDDIVIDELNEQIINKKEIKKPKSSGYWDNIYRIHIKNDNWSATDLPWIQNRTGTWDDPHIIENITISSSGARDGILIEDSNQYFIIRNCTILNCGDSMMPQTHGAIKLKRSSNGTIMDNNCTLNFAAGIFLEENCKNNTIFNNTLFNNNGPGISLTSGTGDGCQNNNISGNTICHNKADGLILDISNYNNITDNTIYENSQAGITIMDSKHNIILGNKVYNNSNWGLLIMGDNTSIINNRIYDGITLYIGGNLTLQNNQLYNCGISIGGGSVEQCASNRIDLSNLVNGKPLYYYCNKSDLSSINFSYAGNPGQIVLSHTSNSIIEDITISHTSYAIFLSSCKNITIKNSNLTKNSNGIMLTGSSINNVSGNEINDNKYYGIIMRISSYNTITQNNISNNENGIYMDAGMYHFGNVDHNLISGNFINHNSEVGIKIDGEANYNTIKNNTINYNNDGISFWGYRQFMGSDHCTDNYFVNNTLNYNFRYGIFFRGYLSGDVFDIYTFILGNKMKSCGIGVRGDTDALSQITINNENKVNGKTVYYYVSENYLGNDNFSTFGVPGQIILIDCKDSYISNFNVSHTSIGISIQLCENITINNNTASFNFGGIEDVEGLKNYIFNNTASHNRYYGINPYTTNSPEVSKNVLIQNNYWGIYIESTVNANLTENEMEGCGIGIFHIFVSEIDSHNIETSNTVNSNPVYYYKNKLNLNPSNFSNAGQVILINCNNSLISNIDVSGGSKGLYLFNCENNTILNINSSYNLFSGIHLYECMNITIKLVNTSLNADGIIVGSSLNNTIKENYIENNYGWGVSVSNSHENLVYNNTFVNNGVNAIDNGQLNRWDNGSLGNFWDDYTGFDVIAPFGIGDTPYLIPGSAGAKDNYPIFYKGSVPPLKIIIIDPAAGTYGPASLLINASITDSKKALAMINATISFNISMTKSGSYWICYWDNISLYTSGDYNITIWAIDIHGYVNDTEFVIITIDTNGPSVLIIDPAAGTYGPASLLINASITDVTQADTMINTSTPFTISMTLSGSYWICSWNNISLYTSGDYNITICAIDNHGNVNATEFVIITIDTDGPSVLIIDPVAGTYGTASLMINASITDVTQAVAMINASMPFNIPMTLSGYYWNCSWNNISLYTSGDYNITIWAIDNNGNVNATEYVVITIDIGGAPGLPAGDDDDDDDGDGKDEFDIVEFLTSPIGLTIIGGSITAVAIITIIKIKGSGKSRVKEIERIERLSSE